MRVRRTIRWLVVLPLSLLVGLHAALTVWTLSHEPFARPVIARSAAEARLAFERAMAREVTPAWLLPRFEAALAAEDLDQLEMYGELARSHGIALPPDAVARAEALRAEHDGTLAQAGDCLACAWDIGNCPTLAALGACNLTVEVTPLGDLNALRRAAVDWATGAPVDGIEAGLAVAGLAATGAIVVSGGTSASAKLGVTAIRVGRRMGTLTAGLGRVLADTVDGLIRWERLGAAVISRNFDEAVDAARLARLSGMAGDLGVVYQRTSAAAAIDLLRHADDAADLRRLARTAEAAGPDSRKVLEVLGKARTFRLLDRVAGAALAASLAGVAMSLLASLALRLVRRALR
jgi:hypothetical protein